MVAPPVSIDAATAGVIRATPGLVENG